MLIRSARRADIGPILDIWKEHMDFHSERYPFLVRSREGHIKFAQLLDKHWKDPDWAVFVAEEEGSVVGYCLATVMDYPPVFEVKRYGFIQDISVTGSCRRRGIGAKLLERTEVWFKERGVRRVELQALLANEVSQSFWRARGYAPYLSRFAKDIS